MNYAAAKGCGKGITLGNARKSTEVLLTAKKRVDIVRASECSRLVFGGGKFEDLGPLFAVSARKSVQVFTPIPGEFLV